MKLIVLYLLLINVLSSIIFAIDKRNSALNKRRVSEKNLLLLSIIGGSLAMLIMMHVIHHKTKKLKFSIGLPLIIVGQATVFLLFLKILEFF